MGCGYTNYDKLATPGNFLVLTNCKNVNILYLDVDGNSDHLSYGGHYCDGIQLPSSGIVLNGTSNVLIQTVNIHHFGLDGIEVYDLKLHNERRNVNLAISNSKFNWNGRVGFHWNSGRKVNVVGCEFNYNAVARFGSKAADGVDFENDNGGAPPENGNFVQCDFLFNLHAGIECHDPRYVSDMTFIKCNFASGEFNSVQSSYAASPNGRNFDFRECNFYGSVIHGYHARITRQGGTQ